MQSGRHHQSKVTGNCLRAFGFTEDADGVRKALLARKAFAVYDAGGYSDLMTGEEALKLWEAAKTNVGGSFNINPPLPRIALAQAKRDDGAFVVDAISTDGGCIPRNVILSQGLSLVKLDILSLSEFAQKTSLNPARMLRLEKQRTLVRRSRCRYHCLRFSNSNSGCFFRRRQEDSLQW